MDRIARLESEAHRSPDDADTLVTLGVAYQEAGRPDDAAAAFARAIEADPANAEACFRFGMSHLLAGDAEAALAWLAAAVERDPAHGIAWSNIGIVLTLLDRPADALAAFEAAQEVAPELDEVRLHIARMRLELGRFEEALAVPLDDLQDEIAAVWVVRGNALTALGRVDAALSASERGLGRFPDDPDLLALAGNLNAIGGDPARAKGLFERALDRNPRHYDALVGLGGLAAGAGSQSMAAVMFERAVAADSHRAAAYQGLATLAFEADDPEGLRHWLELGLTAAPAHPDLLFLQAKLFERDDLPDDAIECLEAALAVNPLHNAAHFELATLLDLHCGDREASRAHLRKTIELAPGTPMAEIAATMLAR